MSEMETTERLVKAAIHLFAQKGFAGTSVKEIADRAGVNISLVSYHFGGKEGLLQSCLETFGRARLATTQKLLEPPASAEELRVRLTMFAEDMWDSHLEQPELCRILQHEKDLGTSIALDVFKSTFLKSFETLVAFLKVAQERRLVNAELDPLLVASFIFGSIVNTAQNDRLGEKFYGTTIKNKKDRARMTANLIECFLHGFTLRKPPKGSNSHS